MSKDLVDSILYRVGNESVEEVLQHGIKGKHMRDDRDEKSIRRLTTASEVSYKVAAIPENIRRGKNIVQAIKRSPIR